MINLSRILGTAFCLLLLAGHAQSQGLLSAGSIPLEDSVRHGFKPIYRLDSILSDHLGGLHEKLDSAKVGQKKSNLEIIGSGPLTTLPGSLTRKGAAFIPPGISRSPLPSGHSAHIAKHMGSVQAGFQKSISLPASMRKYTDPIKAKGRAAAKGAPLGEYRQNADNQINKVSRYKSMSDSLAAIDKERLDTMLIDQAAGLAEKAENRLSSQKELEALGETDLFEISLEEMKAEASGLHDVDIRKLEWKKLQKDHFSDHAAVKEAMSDMRKMKGRYNEIKDSRFLKEGTAKRHSLGDYPFFSRWEWGLHLNIRSFAPLDGEALPMVGYRIDRRWVLGVGPVFSGGMGKGSGPQKVPGSLTLSGYHSYALFTVKKGIFLQGDYQRTRNTSPTDFVRQAYRHTVYGGLGTEFRLFGNFRIRSAVLYRINKKRLVGAGSESPWQASMGIINYKK
jgi:hypothetical protein